MQRPLCCAQAPDIFAFGAFACFASAAGEIDTAARAVAIVALTIHFMEGPLRSHSPKTSQNRAERTRHTLIGRHSLAARAIGGDALVRRPYAAGQFAGLPEHIDRHAA